MNYRYIFSVLNICMQQCLKGKFILKFTSRNNNATFWKRVLPTVDYDFTKHSLTIQRIKVDLWGIYM